MNRDFAMQRKNRGVRSRLMNVTQLPPRYRIAIHRAKGCYFAHVIDLPGCFSRGATEVEAVENARSAIRAYLWLRQGLAGGKGTRSPRVFALRPSFPRA